MPDKLFIPLVLGTGREGRESEKVAKYVFSQLQSRDDFETTFVDVRDYATKATIPSWIEHAPSTRWKEIVTKADGFVFVVPEYNHGYPGELKILLDKLYKEYNGKAVALCGVSAGGLGGARAVENLLPVLRELQMSPIRESVYFSGVKELFDESGEIKDKKFDERVGKMVDMLVAYASALKSMRS